MFRLNFITTFFIAATLGLAAPVSVLAGSDTELSAEEISNAFKISSILLVLGCFNSSLSITLNTGP